MENQEFLQKITKVLEDKKASNLMILDITSISTLADYFVLASADNIRQLDALKDSVEEAFPGETFRNIHFGGLFYIGIR